MGEIHAVVEKFHARNEAKCLINRTRLLHGGKGACALRNGLNAERAIFFNNFCECPKDFGNYGKW